MDILVVSNIFNKFSKIFLNNDKTQLDIDVLSEFLEDPFNIDLEHLNYFYLQSGGADKIDEAVNKAKNAANNATEGEKNQANNATEGEKNQANNATEGDNEENPEEEAKNSPKKKGGFKEGAKKYFSSIMEEVNEPGSTTESSILNTLNFLIKCILYPLLFIFLIIFPYIYVTFTSFTKLLKSYRKNVLTV